MLILAMPAMGPVGAKERPVPLTPPVHLPDGTEFMTWQDTTVHTKTLWVDPHHTQASDDNPGTKEAPFLTINRAARVARAGQRVVISSGEYREKIVPRFGGEGADGTISYEAAPGAEVVVKGSRIVTQAWLPSRNPGQFSETLWMVTLPESLFPEENPFALENASAADIDVMPWAEGWASRVPYTLKRGLVFQNGQRLAQLSTYEDLPRVPGSYWVAPDSLTLHIHPYQEQNPNEALMEVTVQQHLFKPDVTDLGYIRIKGLTFMHAGNGYPRTGVGAIFTMGGHHWLIEENTVTQVGSVGIEIGARTDESRAGGRADSRRAKACPGYTIVRNNTLSQCGTGGIQGLEVRHALIEGNRITDSGWQDVERYWETAGIKLLINRNTLVRRNVITRFMAGPGIWLDWDNQNSRVTQNLLYDLRMCCNGSLFIEASIVPNTIDHNILWNIRGTGIYAGDTDNLIIAHNLIGPCTGPGVHTRTATDRHVQGHPVTSRDNHVVNNLFYTDEPIRFEDPQNHADYNIFADPEKAFDLKAWQQTGQDRNSRRLQLELEFKPSLLRLHWSTQEPMPFVPVLPGMTRDYRQHLRTRVHTTPGPIEFTTSRSHMMAPVDVNPINPDDG